MDIYTAEKVTTVGEAPVGLLILEDSAEMIMKTEYREADHCICYIVASGEYYHGDGDAAKCKPVIIA
jgi:hypothetical protein